MNSEQISLNYTAKMYRAPMTPDKFNSIIRNYGAYDVLVTSNGNSEFIDRDQVGFRYKDLHLDVAYQPDRGVYEFAGFREGEQITVLGDIEIGADRDKARAFVSQIIGQVYQGVKEEGLPVMSIPIVVREKIESYRVMAPLPVVDVSNN